MDKKVFYMSEELGVASNQTKMKTYVTRKKMLEN